MKIAFFSAKKHEIDSILSFNHEHHEFHFIPEPLSETTIHLAHHYDAICCFVTDPVNEKLMTQLAEYGVKLIALRSAGYDHVDLMAAKKNNITVVRVPQYSPEAVAEFATALLLSLTRKIPLAFQKSAIHDYSLTGLLGTNLHEKKVGILGGGLIGTAFAKIMLGFGAQVRIYDPNLSATCYQQSLNITKVSMEQVITESDIISLHTPLTSETQHLINDDTIGKMKKSVILINTGRGGLIDTAALIRGLESKKIGAAGLDVYENERGLFFSDHSHEAINDPLLIKLQSFPNVIITGHIAFFSQEAINNIAQTTIQNIDGFENNQIINCIQ